MVSFNLRYSGSVTVLRECPETTPLIDKARVRPRLGKLRLGNLLPTRDTCYRAGPEDTLQRSDCEVSFNPKAVLHPDAAQLLVWGL